MTSKPNRTRQNRRRLVRRGRQVERLRDQRLRQLLEPLRGCPICGVQNEEGDETGRCERCARGTDLAAMHGHREVCVVVDGSFVPMPTGPGLPVTGYGGAGLVLVRGALPTGEILDEVACSFGADGSAEAELQAVLRASRWAPGAAIYSDARELEPRVAEHGIRVSYLGGKRPSTHARAHVLSVEGRCRGQPGISAQEAVDRAKRSALPRSKRLLLAVNRMLDAADGDPSFAGDFEAIAERFGWTSGGRWRQNPAIKLAAKEWAKRTSPAAEP